jgi:hypothetical protein
MSSHHDERESGKSVMLVKGEGEDNSSSRGVRLCEAKRSSGGRGRKGRRQQQGGGSCGLDLATNDHDFPHTEVKVAMRPHEVEAPLVRGRGVGGGGGG